MTLIVNLFGVPGAGKSTGAAQVFANLKKKGINAELVKIKHTYSGSKVLKSADVTEK